MIFLKILGQGEERGKSGNGLGTSNPGTRQYQVMNSRGQLASSRYQGMKDNNEMPRDDHLRMMSRKIRRCQGMIIRRNKLPEEGISKEELEAKDKG